MPRRIFWQPYDAELPDPTRWEFQFLPVQPDGWPGTPLVLLPDGLSEEWVSCDATMIVDECSTRLITFTGSHFDYPAAAEIDACVADNLNRCRHVDVQTPPDGWLEVRACGDFLNCSQWTATPVPEVDFITAVLVGTLLLGGIINERAWRRRRARVVRGVWFQGQRRPLRRRVREMLRHGLRLVGVRR